VALRRKHLYCDEDIVIKRGFQVLVFGLFHETHCFLRGSTGTKAFEIREEASVFDAMGDSSPLGGVLEYADQQGWDVVPTLCASAVPGPMVEAEVFERYWHRFEEIAAPRLAAGVDAIFAILHGAFVCDHQCDVDGEVLRRIRTLPGASSIPMFGVYDLHANYSQAMAMNADCLVGYRENPHTDARESAIRAAALMSRSLLERKRPRQVLKQVPVLLPPTATASRAQPMKRLLELARSLEKQHSSFWAVNVNAGFAYADTPDTGLSFSIVTDGDEDEAQEALKQLTELALEHLEDCTSELESMQQVFHRLKEMQRSGGLPGLTVLVEPSDNIGAGAPGNGTALLQAMVENEIANGAICLWAPEAVELLSKNQPGDVVSLQFEGSGSMHSNLPLFFECKLLRLCDGLFELENKQSHLASMSGDRFDMGQCAIVTHRGVVILLTSNRTPPMDLGQWRHVGLAPEKYSVLVVKAAVAHRKAYDPIATRQIWVDTPGPCSSNLTSFAYGKIRRPMFPLDVIL
jgi:microcystin degradation protein MlrC